MDQGSGKFFTPGAHAAIIDHQYGDAVTHKNFIEEQSGSAPCIADRLAVRASVWIVEQWNLFARAIGRQVQKPMQNGSVFRFEIDELRRNQLERINAPGLPENVTASAHMAERELWRRHKSREVINKILAIGRNRGRVRSAFGQALEVGTIQLYAA